MGWKIVEIEISISYAQFKQTEALSINEWSNEKVETCAEQFLFHFHVMFKSEIRFDMKTAAKKIIFFGIVTEYIFGFSNVSSSFFLYYYYFCAQ